MKLKKIALASMIFLSASLASFSQDKLKFDVYSNAILGTRLNIGSLRVSENEVDFSFLFGLYSMQFKNLNDSNYKEIVQNNIPFQVKEELFNYSKGSGYTLSGYSALKGKSRAEKEDLEKKTLNEKYENIPKLFNQFMNNTLFDNGDSVHTFVNGLPYSFKVKREKYKDGYIYSTTLDVRRDSGDIYIAPYPIEAYVVERGGKLIPIKFSTSLLDVKKGEKVYIEGILKEKKK